MNNTLSNILKKSISFILVFCLSISIGPLKMVDAAPVEGVTYQSHVRNIGWQGWTSNGNLSGTEGKALSVEAIRIKPENLPSGTSISYRAHVESIGWQGWVKDGALAGTEGKALSVEAIEIKLEGAPAGYHIEYRAHVQDIGWQSWSRDGKIAGTTGRAKAIEALQIRIVKGEAPEDVTGLNDITYSTKISSEGWKSWTKNGTTNGSGAENKMEAFKIKIENTNLPVKVLYRAHVENIGWQNWVNDGNVAGTEGTGYSVQALEIKLDGAQQGYHVKYRTKVQGAGWQAWKQDGQMSGTVGQSKPIVAMEVKIVKDQKAPTVTYKSHVQDEGWQAYKSNGQLSGTVGKARKLEAIIINGENLPSGNELTYRTHIEGIGWQGWRSSGELSGTEGQNKRLEGIQIKLKEPIEGYELFYRVHVQDIGWQEWKKSGETAGTSGQAKRLEGIEIKFVKNKDKLIVVDPGHNHGGNDGAYATHNGVTYCERDLNMDVSLKLRRELEAKGFTVVLGRNPEDRETIGVRPSLEKRVNLANWLNADFFISVHQNTSTSSSAKGVEVYYSSATPLSGGRLLNNEVEVNEVEEQKKKTRRVQPDKVVKSSKISRDIVDGIANGMGMVNRGAKDNDFFVVKNTYMPSILLECGFISNPTEARNLASHSRQQLMAEIVADKIDKNF